MQENVILAWGYVLGESLNTLKCKVPCLLSAVSDIFIAKLMALIFVPSYTFDMTSDAYYDLI